MTNEQEIKSFHGGVALTFSAQCSKCQRWIWCGEDDHEGTCHCGHPYRVVFDDDEKDWTMKKGKVCMECGKPVEVFRERTGVDQLRHYPPGLAWQYQCLDCTPKLAEVE